MAKANTPLAIYDAIVIGAGQAGPPLARRLAAAGMAVAVIERAAFGGLRPTERLVTSAFGAKGEGIGVRGKADASGSRGTTTISMWVRPE